MADDKKKPIDSSALFTLDHDKSGLIEVPSISMLLNRKKGIKTKTFTQTGTKTHDHSFSLVAERGVKSEPMARRVNTGIHESSSSASKSRRSAPKKSDTTATLGAKSKSQISVRKVSKPDSGASPQSTAIGIPEDTLSDLNPAQSPTSPPAAAAPSAPAAPEQEGGAANPVGAIDIPMGTDPGLEKSKVISDPFGGGDEPTDPQLGSDIPQGGGDPMATKTSATGSIGSFSQGGALSIGKPEVAGKGVSKEEPTRAGPPVDLPAIKAPQPPAGARGPKPPTDAPKPLSELNLGDDGAPKVKEEKSQISVVMDANDQSKIERMEPGLEEKKDLTSLHMEGFTHTQQQAPAPTPPAAPPPFRKPPGAPAAPTQNRLPPNPSQAPPMSPGPPKPQPVAPGPRAPQAPPSAAPLQAPVPPQPQTAPPSQTPAPPQNPTRVPVPPAASPQASSPPKIPTGGPPPAGLSKAPTPSSGPALSPQVKAAPALSPQAQKDSKPGGLRVIQKKKRAAPQNTLSRIQRSIAIWDMPTLQQSNDPLGKGLLTLIHEGAICALFLAIHAPPPGSRLPQFLGTAGIGPGSRLQFWNGMVWNPEVVPEIWNVFVKSGFVVLEPLGLDNSPQHTNRKLARGAFGVSDNEYLTLVRVGPPQACRGILALVSKQDIKGAVNKASAILAQPVKKKAA